MPDVSPAAGRAKRAAENMKENMGLFVPLLLAAVVGHGDAKLLVAGAWTFFVARVVYLVGAQYLRTLVWCVGIFGMGLLIASLAGA